ncbi:ZIP family metal transporter [Paenibacillus sp. JX-17]|uniref:ZIP family metal transporter n=1 Tax=Paenibacillus lacisoli TaxID=3064525 RepID=A0ABT9CJ21_9BACL|nr:ZIP family metal transporter [Paenibacillus sp. JX-17]MDO7908619.1 ZIP family metal transporter [Paenibacillus sp. JX-17]
MWSALMWGGISGSAVLLGALIAGWFEIKKAIIAAIMAFGTGILMGAAAYELLGDAVEDGGLLPTAIGFLLGAIVFTGFDWMIARKGGKNRKRSGGQDDKASGKSSGDSGSGLGIFIGTVMDAIPESVMIGASLLAGGSVSWLLVISIFVSNIPEGLSSTVGLKQGGYSRRTIFLMWGIVLAISALASMAGYTLLEHAPEPLMAGIGAFAGGGIIAMIASTMMPEAYEEGGPWVGLITALGLFTSLVLSSLS